MPRTLKLDTALSGSDRTKIHLADAILGKQQRRHSNLFKLPSVTTSKEGKRLYMRKYMKERRRRQGK